MYKWDITLPYPWQRLGRFNMESPHFYHLWHNRAGLVQAEMHVGEQQARVLCYLRQGRESRAKLRLGHRLFGRYEHQRPKGFHEKEGDGVFDSLTQGHLVVVDVDVGGDVSGILWLT